MSKTYNSKKNPNHKPKSKSAYVSVLKNGVISLKKGRRLKCYISKDQVGRNIIVTCFTRSEIRKAVKSFNKHNKGFCASLKEDEELNCFKVTIYQEDGNLLYGFDLYIKSPILWVTFLLTFLCFMYNPYTFNLKGVCHV